MKRLLLIDANSLIHRLYHALPPLTDREGSPAGALYGLASIVLKILREEKPDYIGACFDRPEPTFRKEKFHEYKIHRPKAPDDLVSQITRSKDLFEQFRIATVELAGFEADDVIGAIATRAAKEGDWHVTILSGDLDLLQLVRGDAVIVKTIKKGVSETALYNEEAVRGRFALAPHQLPDYKGLVGDQSDNIPGVKGVGPKTASALIKKYGGLDALLEKGAGEKIYEKIVSHKDIALLSRDLATIRTDAPINLNGLATLTYEKRSDASLAAYFERMGFKSLAKRIENGDAIRNASHSASASRGPRSKKKKPRDHAAHGTDQRALF